MKDNSNFCVFPFIHAVQNPYDPSNSKCCSLPCCRFDNNRANTETEEFVDPINKSPIWTKLQQQFLNNDRPEECAHCWRDESSSSGHSYRKYGLTTYKNIVRSGDYRTKKLRFLEIMLSNVCNLACRSCNAGFSSKWNDVDQFLSDNNFYVWRRDNIAFPDWRQLDLSNLLTLKIMGGEPLYQKDAYELLTHLDSLDVLPNLDIIIPTNCTIFPKDQLIKLITKAKTVYFNLSIDGYGKLNDYIRAGSTWEAIEENIHRYIELSKNNSKIHLSSNTVITALNVNKITDLENYLDTIGISSYFDVTSFPSHLSILTLPEHVKTSVRNLSITHKIDHAFKIGLPKLEDFEKLKQSIILLDQYHNRKFEDYNPEMHHIIFNC